MVGRRAYDFMYRRGAPWEGDAREELVTLVTSGRLTPRTLPPGRAVDLGCGSGANSIFLAEQGFDVTGIDFSPVALAKAARSAEGHQGMKLRFVEGDLTGSVVPGMEGVFDLVVDYGTLDDLRGQRRTAMAATIKRCTRPGGVFLLWCFYDEIPWWRRRGARFPGVKPGQERTLFGDAFSIERLDRPAPGSGFACLLMTRSPGNEHAAN